MKRIITLLLIIVLFACGVKKTEDNTDFDYQFSVSDSLIIDIEASSISANDTLIIITEKYGETICGFDINGNKKFVIGGHGSGPGEFLTTPSYTTIVQDFIVAADIPEFQLEIFHLNGIYHSAISYVEQMITPVSNIIAYREKLIVEGLSISMQGSMSMIHKVITVDIEKEEILEESVTKLRNIASFEDVFKNLNPFELKKTYFPLHLKIAKIINPNLIRIYSENDSFDLSLHSIPSEKVSQKIVDHLTDSIMMPNITLKFPEYLPKLNQIFSLSNKLLLITEKQIFDNQLNSSNNKSYIYCDKNDKFVEIDFPEYIPVSKISYVYCNKIFVIEEEKVKIYECKFQESSLR